MKKKILFISHEATRTGAPLLLLDFVKWVEKNGKNKYELTVLFQKGGPLINEFNKYSNTYLISKYNQKTEGLKTQLLSKLYSKKLNKEIYLKKWDLIFSNTIVNGKIIEKFNKKIPVISYIHELNHSVKMFSNKGVAQGTLINSTKFICGSKAVQDNLISNYNIDVERTSVVYSFTSDLVKNKDEVIADQIKKELKIPNEALIVAMAGTFNWRKGYDLFVDTAELLQNYNIYFIWIGVNNPMEINKINYDLDKKSSNPKLVFIPSSKDYKKYFNIIDVFFLSSREDPYPLVMLDATSMGIPVICFKDAGGTEEFIDDKTGFIAPYGNIKQVSDRIIYYNENRNILKDNKDYIKKKTFNSHNINENANSIVMLIDSLLK